MLLEIRELSSCINDKVIVNKVNLSVDRGEIHVIMGPNGSGKSTLLSTIMGLPHIRVCNGRILFDGLDITDKPSYERAKLGIALAHQYPPEIKGVKFSDIAKAIISKYGCGDCSLMARILRVDELLDRDLFVGFSGGEKKRSELYLVMLQSPKLALLDEPDSGVDVESIEYIANAIEYLRSRGTAVILVTHTGMITNKLSRINRIHIMINGTIKYNGYPDEVLPVIMKFGYSRGLEVLNRTFKGGI
ncbi:MAG: ABC transporter [Desulfurococcales archaeon ex4484_58]|nr:MAG: ABC transporter [Desulfurococcales archaeon ex4484_58]